MKANLVVESPNLLNPDSCVVVCGNEKKIFSAAEFPGVCDWVLSIWEDIEKTKLFPVYPVAKIYYNIDWDNDGVYYGYLEKI